MAAEAKRATRPHPPQMVKCPRCNSSETKFCYYNNYSTAQPRYFCKNCKRYWTDGGTLRNVPVGGGLRKNKRSKTKLNHMPSSSLPTASMNEHIPSFLMPEDGVNQSTIAVHAGLHNPSPDVNLGLPHTPNYLLFNPRNYEMDMKAASLSGHLPLYQPELNIRQPVAPSMPLPMLASGLKNDPSLSGAYFAASPWHLREHERGLSHESLQHGEHLLRNENSSVSYNLNSFVNVNDWQQVSEGFFGAGGDDNYALMQPPKSAQWTDFDAGTRS